MQLAANSYGKSRVRVMRVQRGPERHDVSELSFDVCLHGEFAAAYTQADNSRVIATDTIRNVINIVAREHVAAEPETLCLALAERFLDRYAQVHRVVVNTRETRWSRVTINGVPHPHGFVLDANGTPTVSLDRSRDQARLRSGVAGYTFLKSTGSGWENYVNDELTTLAPTNDRIAATSMDAIWHWSKPVLDYEATNTEILRAMLECFVATYSRGMQDSVYRMSQAALAAAAVIDDIEIVCPNRHYLPVNLTAFGMAADRAVFTPTDEPQGQIHCRVTR